MQMNSMKSWDLVILQHAFISSFLIKMTVMTQKMYNILLFVDWYYASSSTDLYQIGYIHVHSVIIHQYQFILIRANIFFL